MSKKLLVFGAGECGSIARFYFEKDGGRPVAGFVVDDAFYKEEQFAGLPVLPLSQAPREFPPEQYDMHVGIAYGGSNAFRQRKFDACRAAGYYLPSYVSTKASVWPDLVCGQNCLILEQASVQPGARIGSNVVIGTGCRVAHGNVIHDHVYAASDVCLGGNCEIGERCFLGIGSIVKELSKIGADSFVTMGAAVTKDLPPNSVVFAAASVIADPESAAFILERTFPDPESGAAR